MTRSEALYARSPVWLQTALVSLYGVKLVLLRRGPAYWRFKAFYRQSTSWSRQELEAYQLARLSRFLRRARAESPFYREWLSDDAIRLGSVRDLERLPALSKETFRQNLDRIQTVRRGVIVHTGGTTGKPLEVVFRRVDIEERMAALDVWRESHGVPSWCRRATFSGRIVVPVDVANARGPFARTNLVLRQRLYSTFHLHQGNLDDYVDDLERFRPDFIDGFPSAIALLAGHLATSGRRLRHAPRAVFSTSENLYDYQRDLIRRSFGCEARDQYASAEGAPFVTECVGGRMHYDLRTGVIEQGERGILVTSFTTSGTPLIRYAVGDRMDLTPGSCDCGSSNPVITSLLGREQDYVVSPTRGMVGVGLIDIFKKLPPVVKQAQIVQDVVDRLVVRLVIDQERFRDGYLDVLREGIVERVGNEMKIEFELVERIEPEAGGKVRYIKRNPMLRWSLAEPPDE